MVLAYDVSIDIIQPHHLLKNRPHIVLQIRQDNIRFDRWVNCVQVQYNLHSSNIWKFQEQQERIDIIEQKENSSGNTYTVYRNDDYYYVLVILLDNKIIKPIH